MVLIGGLGGGGCDWNGGNAGVVGVDGVWNRVVGEKLVLCEMSYCLKLGPYIFIFLNKIPPGAALKYAHIIHVM